MKSKLLLLAWALLFLPFLTGIAWADLTIDISGHPGGNLTRWTIEGSIDTDGSEDVSDYDWEFWALEDYTTASWVDFTGPGDSIIQRSIADFSGPVGFAGADEPHAVVAFQKRSSNEIRLYFPGHGGTRFTGSGATRTTSVDIGRFSPGTYVYDQLTLNITEEHYTTELATRSPETGTTIHRSVSNGTIVVSGLGANGFQVSSVPAPNLSAPLATIGNAGTVGSVPGGGGLALSGDILYVADSVNFGRIRVFDLTNPATPLWLTDIPLSSLPFDVACDGDTLAIAHSTGLSVYDVSNPASPSLLDTLPQSSIALGTVALANGHIFWMRGDDPSGFIGELAIIDMSTPSNLSESSVTTVGAWPAKPVLRDNVLYTGTSASVRTYDVSDPAAPIALDSMSFADHASSSSLTLHLEFLFVKAENGEMWIYDAVDPASLRKVEATSYGTTDVTAAGDLLYLSAGLDGLTVLDATDSDGDGIPDACDQGDGIDDRQDCNGDFIADGLQLSGGLYRKQFFNDGLIPCPDGDTHSLASNPPAAESDVTLFFSAQDQNVGDADQHLEVYVNDSYIGNVFEGTQSASAEDSLTIASAAWNAFRLERADHLVEIRVVPNDAVCADPETPFFISFLEVLVSYELDADENDNGWLDECLPDCDPDDPDSDGDGVPDACDLSPGTIADPSIVDALGRPVYNARLDFDGDGDVDATDLAALSTSLDGPGQAVPAAGAPLDLDTDGDLDLHDAAALLNSSRGTGMAADPTALGQKLPLFRLIEFPYFVSFDYGENYCNYLYGTHMAVVDDARSVSIGEQITELTAVAAQDSGDSAWIGLAYDPLSNRWKWSDGQDLKLPELGDAVDESNWKDNITPDPENDLVKSFYVLANHYAGYEWSNIVRDPDSVRNVVAQLPDNMIPAMPATTTQTVTVTLTSTQAGGNVVPGDTIDWSITFQTSTGDNAGLALLVTDLTQAAGNPASITLSPSDAVPGAMANFAAPAGIGNPSENGAPAGYVGLLRGGDLIQIGGAQNNLGEALPGGTQGQSTAVTAGLGQSGSILLASGSFTAPDTLGTYTLNLANTIANVFDSVQPAPAASETVQALLNLSATSMSFTVIDVTPPVITLLGDNPLTLECGIDTYSEPGATALDPEEGDLSSAIVIDSSAVDPSSLGSYSVTYNVSDSSGNAAAETTRTIEVVDTTAPTITAPPNVAAEIGDPVDLGTPVVSDACDPSPAASNDAPATYPLGVTIVTWTATDGSGNMATTTQQVTMSDTNAPVITLNGDSEVTVWGSYHEAGATALDAYDGVVPVVIGGDTVLPTTPGTYVVTYQASDSSGNTAQTTRTVHVVSPLFVNDTATGTGDGSSWENAYPLLQDALAAAVSGQIVVVAEGTYYPDEGGGKTDNAKGANFRMVNGIQIIGGFPESSSGTSLTGRAPSLFLSILDGEIQQDGNLGNNSTHVVNGSGVDATAILDGFTIARGTARAGSGNGARGGGLLVNGGAPLISNCTFVENQGLYGGGAAQITSAATPTFTNCQFVGNWTGSGTYGGAVRNVDGSTPIFTNCLFSGNAAGFGGAIVNVSCNPVFINCTISGNKSLRDTPDSAGAIQNVDANPVMTNCIVWNNEAENGTTSMAASVVNQGTSTPVYSHSLIANFTDLQLGGVGNLDGTDQSNDPLFVLAVDPTVAPTAAGDLRLTMLSPLRERGDNSAVISTNDLAGNARIQQCFVDLGAYEYASNIPAAYCEWIESHFPGETDPAITGLYADPNQDGRPNIQHFAFNTDPLGAGGDEGKVRGSVIDDDGTDYFSLTLPLPSGAAFTGSPNPAAAVDGIIYTAQGSFDLSLWDATVVEVSPASSSGLPALDAGWSYRTFRLDTPANSQPRGFLRVEIAEIP